MDSSKKILLSTIFIALLVVLASGLTFAFFNYTRIGLANNIRVGRINFNTSQNDNINLTNVFPISTVEAETDTTNTQTVSINIVGDTDYVNGIEYVVTATDVNMSVGSGANTKTMPVAIDVSVSDNSENNPETTLGTEETGDYFLKRYTYDTSKYKVVYDGNLNEGAQIVVGYISPNTTPGTASGIDGIINIKAYLDSNKILVSDTWNNGSSPTDNLGTPLSMGRGKVVFTTNEWNSIQGSPLSFKIKVEANEGIWVEESTETPASCFETGPYYTSIEFNDNLTPSQIATCVSAFESFSEPYEDESLNDFCSGNGTFTSRTLEEWSNALKESGAEEILNPLIEANIVAIVVDGIAITGYNSVGLKNNKYILNTNMTEDELTICLDFLGGRYFQEGESALAFCQGTGTYFGYTFDEWLDGYNNQISASNYCIAEELVDANVLIPVAERLRYMFNESITSEEINNCANYLTQEWGVEEDGVNVYTGETYQDFCSGTGTRWGYTFQEILDNHIIQKEDRDYFLNNSIIYEVYEDVLPEKCGIDVTIPEKIDGQNVTAIGEYAFNSTYWQSESSDKPPLRSVVLPNTLKVIGSNAFRSNGLTSINIPNSVLEIHESAFEACLLTEVNIPDSVVTIGEYAFKGNQISTVTLGSGVEEIGNHAFASGVAGYCYSSSSAMGDGCPTNSITSVTIKGKTDVSDFTSYGSSLFGWAEGYDDNDIIFTE